MKARVRGSGEQPRTLECGPASSISDATASATPPAEYRVHVLGHFVAHDFGEDLLDLRAHLDAKLRLEIAVARATARRSAAARCGPGFLAPRIVGDRSDAEL